MCRSWTLDPIQSIVHLVIVLSTGQISDAQLSIEEDEENEEGEEVEEDVGVMKMTKMMKIIKMMKMKIDIK